MLGIASFRELIKLGFRVRAGVRNAQREESLVQIAELMAVMARNRDLSYCRILEAIAETTAPLTPMEELLAKIPSQRAYNFPPKTPDVAAAPGPAPSAGVVVEEPSITTQKETAQPKPVTKQPLSPYTVATQENKTMCLLDQNREQFKGTQ